MATIHLFLTGKGGVGKSYAASLLYQYLRKHSGRSERPYQLLAYDTDPVNSTFAGYAEFSDELSVPLNKLIGPDEYSGADEYGEPDDYYGSDEAESEGAARMPELPDGIGLDYDDIRVLLTMKHKTAVEDDEPILMLVTLCNAFLGETEALHRRHNEALSQIIAGKTKEYLSGVKQSSESFTRTLADASVEGVRQIFEKHAAALQAHRDNARWCAAVVAISALANIIALAAL